MSAADSIAKVGSGVKGLAIGAAILAALAAAWWAWKKADKVAAAAKGAGGFLFGADDAPETLGTWIYDKLNPPPDDNALPPVERGYFNIEQAKKICDSRYPPGSGKTPEPGSLCAQVLNSERLSLPPEAVY